jgi:P27 family predicted phage terminase small subunit
VVHIARTTCNAFAENAT